MPPPHRPPPPPPPLSMPLPKRRRKQNIPDPPMREMRSRQTKSDAMQRGFGNPRGTSKSPHLLRQHAADNNVSKPVCAGDDDCKDFAGGMTDDVPMDDVVEAPTEDNNLSKPVCAGDDDCKDFTGGMTDDVPMDDGDLGYALEEGLTDDSGVNGDASSVGSSESGASSDDSSVEGGSLSVEIEELSTPAKTTDPPPSSSTSDSSYCIGGETINCQQFKTRKPQSFMLDLIVCVELSYFAHRHNVDGDGNCGYYSVMYALIRHFNRVCPEHPSLRGELSSVSFSKANWFRNIIHEYVSREFESLLDPSNPKFVDEFGERIMDFKIRKGLTEGHQRMTTHDGRSVSSFFLMLDNIFNK